METSVGAAGGAAPAARRIAVGFDGVLFDHVPCLLRGFGDAHGTGFQEEGFRHRDFSRHRAVRERNLTWAASGRSSTSSAPRGETPRQHRHGLRARRPRDTEGFLRRNRIPHDMLMMGASRKAGWDVRVDDALATS